MAQPVLAAPLDGAPVAAQPAGELVLTGIRARRFPAGSRLLDESSTTFLEAAVPAAGVELDLQRLHHQRGSSYADLARELLPDLVAGRTVQLLVLAHVVPDFHISDVAAIAASQAIGGTRASFGVCDQGPLAAFTALRLAQGFAGRQGYERVVVLVADQHVLPYDTGAERLDGDAAVALVLERRSGQRPLAVAHRGAAPGAAPQLVGAALDEVLVELSRSPAGPPIDVFTGAGVPTDWAPAAATSIRRSAPGYPCTGAWDLLAARGLPEDRSVVLLDVDTDSGHVGGVRLDPVAGDQSASDR